MIGIVVEIVRYISDQPQPGLVECRLIDAWKREWLFEEKTAIVSSDYLDSKTVYPQSGVIACQIIEERQSKDKQIVITVDTSKPWHVEALTGESRFDVLQSQIVEL
jgi:hypothetical protein